MSETMGDRLKMAREAAGFASATRGAERVGAKVSTYRAHENGQNDFSAEDAEVYARAFGVRAGWLLTGELPMERSTPTHRQYQSQVIATIPLRIVPSFDPDDHAQDGDFDPGAHGAMSSVAIVDGEMRYRPVLPNAVPELCDRPGAGEGQAGAEQVYALDVGGTVVGHEVAGEWVIPNHFLGGRLHATARRTLIMSVVGESMRPTLDPDDRVIVNLADNRHRADGVYVIAIGDHEPQIKRLIRVVIDGEPKIRVVSDNGGIFNDVRPDDIKIIGRVIGRISRM